LNRCGDVPEEGPSARLKWARSGCALGLAVFLILPAACTHPSKANIELRKEKQALEARIQSLEEQRTADQARIRGLEEKVGTIPTLPESRLDEMFTAHGIRIGQLTGGYAMDVKSPWDQGIKVYLTPVDDSGEPIKATGEVTVEAFELGKNPPLRLGKWTFTPAQMKDSWRGFGLIHAFVLMCPWQVVPTARNITLDIRYQDELTGRVFSALQKVTVNPPPATQPASQPATRPEAKGAI